MDLLDIVRACVRRWYVFFPVIALTGYLAVGQYQAAQPQYTATTSAVVVASRDLVVARGVQSQGGDPVTTPFNGGSGASSLAGMLRTALNTTTVRQQLLPDGGVAIAADRDTEEDGALVTVTLTATSEARVAAAQQTVAAGMNGVLNGLQTAAGAPGNQLYVTVPGGPTDPPVGDYPDRLRGVVGLSLAGGLAAVVLSVLVQALARGRVNRAAAKPALAPRPRQRAPRSDRGGVSAGATPPFGPPSPSSRVDVRGSRTGSHR